MPLNDTNTTTAAEAVERVGQAIQQGRATGSATGLYVRIPFTELDDAATAAIAAHTAWLWERSRQPDVVEAVAKAIDEAYETDDDLDQTACGDIWLANPKDCATAALTATLMLLLGPRPESEAHDAN